MSRPITILELAVYRGARESSEGVMPCEEIHRVGLPCLGGCARCGETIAAYNAHPSRLGFILCAGCIDEHRGWLDLAEANEDLFAGEMPEPPQPAAGASR